MIDVRKLRKVGDTGIFLRNNSGKTKLPQKKEPKQVSLSRFSKPEIYDIIKMKNMGDDSKVSLGAPKLLVKPKPAVPTKQLDIFAFNPPKSPAAVVKPAGRLPTYDARRVARIVNASKVYLRQFDRQGVNYPLASDNMTRALYLGLKAANTFAVTNRLGPEKHADLITAVRDKINAGERDAGVINHHLSKLVERMYDLRKNGIDVVK